MMPVSDPYLLELFLRPPEYHPTNFIMVNTKGETFVDGV